MNDPAPKKKSPVLAALTSESFIEKLVLLLLTVLLTGLLVPYITTEIQRRKTRNDIIIQAQTDLLNDVTKTLMAYETLLLDISWYQTSGAYNREMHKRAFQRYSDRVVDLLSDWRVVSIKARSLSSLEVSDKLDKFQSKMFQSQDIPLSFLYPRDSSVTKWEGLHRTNTKMLIEAGELISELAKEMKLTKENIR